MPKKILIVEDEVFNADLLSQIIEDAEENYEILIATNGATGIELTKQARPDLILMDLNLPLIDGWDATRCIKSDDALADIPIIALTAYAMIGDRERALACGCDDYLPKPLDEDALLEKLAHYLKD